MAENLETWYVASGTWVLPSLVKWLPWVDLDLFYGKVKFGPLCFCLGKTMFFQKLLLSKKISDEQELIQSDPTSCPQNQKGNN